MKKQKEEITDLEAQEDKVLYKCCLRCGRKLKSVEARTRGYGIICEKKMKEIQVRRLF